LVRWALRPDPERAGFHNEPQSINPPCALSIVKSEELAKTLELYPSGRFCIPIPDFQNVFFYAGGEWGNGVSLPFGWVKTWGDGCRSKRNTRVAETTLVGLRKVMKIQPETLRGVSGRALKMLIDTMAWNFS
jgi:hypothetical protein